MSDLGGFIAAHPYSSGDATVEDLAEDIEKFQSGADQFEPTMAQIIHELDTYREYSYRDQAGYTKTKKRTTAEIDAEIAKTVEILQQKLIRLRAVQQIRAVEVDNPSWWRRAFRK